MVIRCLGFLIFLIPYYPVCYFYFYIFFQFQIGGGYEELNHMYTDTLTHMCTDTLIQSNRWRKMLILTRFTFSSFQTHNETSTSTCSQSHWPMSRHWWLFPNSWRIGLKTRRTNDKDQDSFECIPDQKNMLKDTIMFYHWQSDFGVARLNPKP